jgi:ABC-type Fe3+ transport system permease subunit
MKYSQQDNVHRFNHNYIIFFVSISIILVLTVYPFIMLILNSLGLSVHGFNFTLDAYKKCLLSKDMFYAAKNTIYTAAGVTILSGIFGVGLAFVVNKTNILKE